MTRATDNHDSSRRHQLLQLLADGEFHSGEVLAEQLGVTRAAVWKLINALREMGVSIESHARQGYHLPHAVTLYDSNSITGSLSVVHRKQLQRVDVLMSVDSTNEHVSANPATKDHHAVLCVSELQLAGRGRRGRSWLAPFGSGICMSLGYLFDEVPHGFSALTLVVGIALIRALHEIGLADAKLKWPNDVVWHGHKLAGVLTEMRGESAGPTHVVIGIGCNFRIPDITRQELSDAQAGVTDLHEALGGRVPDRNLLVALFTAQLLDHMQKFSRQGFAAFIHEWEAYDALRNAEVKVLHAEQTVLGLARGVTEDGSLLIETPQGIQRFTSAEVSLRVAV
ncbi:MAG TPA: biotin--[acetyl-CoA-carboxylase] ligase [Steroidobacteraceae bacterium]|nr:biotin--[acetyl-CoA-carboxylase] ligase [Steroidobacteraceae bacterium]